MTKNYIHVFFLGVALGIIFKTIYNILIMERTVCNENLGAGRDGADAAHLKLKKSGARVDKQEDRSLPKSRARSTKNQQSQAIVTPSSPIPFDPGDLLRSTMVWLPFDVGDRKPRRCSAQQNKCKGTEAQGSLARQSGGAVERGAAKQRCSKLLAAFALFSCILLGADESHGRRGRRW